MEDIIDGDGDRWEDAGNGGYRCVTWRHGISLTRDAIRNRFGIPHENAPSSPVTEPRVFKPVTIPDDVTKVRNAMGTEYVRKIDGEWVSSGGIELSENQLLNLNPSGLTEVVETDYDKAVAYFKNYEPHTDPSWLPNSETKKHLAALINNIQESK